MHEKDIELARLLIARDTELRERSAVLQTELNAVESRVAEAKAQSEQRDAYADILAKAADLLQRSDLTVETPDTGEDEARLAELQQQVSELEAQDQQYQELINALKERAPQLFDAATGALLSTPPGAATAALDVAEAAESVSSTVPDTSEPAVAIEDELAEPEPETAEEFAVDAEPVQSAAPEAALQDTEPEPEPQEAVTAEPAAADAPAAEPEPSSEPDAVPEISASPNLNNDWDESVKLYVAGRGQAVEAEADSYAAWTPPAETNGNGAHPSEPDEPLTSEELERFLQRFNLEQIQKETEEALGGEAAYVIDAASVLDNIPYYDREIRGGPARFIRDELLRDIDLLSRRLNGKVYLVLDQPHESEQKVSSKVAVRSLSPADKGRREAAEELFKQVLAEATKSGKPVSFVTGDAVLGGSLRSRRVHFFPLGDFFRT